MKRLWITTAASALFCAFPSFLPAQEENLFERLDTNKDGQLAADEVDEERRRLFDRLLRNGDKNGDGKLSLEEFTQATREQPAVTSGPAGGPNGGPGNLPNPRELFQRFDKDSNGKLSKEEVPDRMRENFDRIDANKDGQVDPEELRQAFANMMRREGPPGRPEGNPMGRLNAEMIDRMFAQGDKNGDGKLTKDEVPEERRENFARLIARVDQDGDGAVTKEQLLQAFTALREQAGRRPEGDRKPDASRRPSPEGRPATNPGAPGFPPPLLAALDANSDGELSQDEIEGAAQALRSLDKNGDGKVTRDELAPRRP